MSIFTHAFSRTLTHFPKILPEVRLIQPGTREYEHFIALMAETSHGNITIQEREMQLDLFFLKNMENRGLFITEKNKTIVGFSHVLSLNKLIQVEGMYVKPRMRGKGIGSEMLTSMVYWGKAKGADTLRIEVPEKDENARSFFQKYDSKFKCEVEKGFAVYTKEIH